MKRKLATVAALAAAAMILAACATGFGVRTDLAEDVPSACDQSYGAYEGYRLHCERLKKQTARAQCPTSDRNKANEIRSRAVNFCAGNPPTTPANLATIRALVKEQNAVGRQK